MRIGLPLLLLGISGAACQPFTGQGCSGPGEHIIADFSGYVVRNGTYFPAVRLSGFISDGAFAQIIPGVTEQWILAKDVLLNGLPSEGYVGANVSGSLPGGQLYSQFSVGMLSPHAVGDTLLVERWPATECQRDPHLVCVTMVDPAVPHPLWLSGMVRVVGRKPAIWALDLVSEPDTRAQLTVVGTIRFRHGTTPRTCYSD